MKSLFLKSTFLFFPTQHLMDEMDNSDTIITEVYNKGDEILQSMGNDVGGTGKLKVRKYC